MSEKDIKNIEKELEKAKKIYEEIEVPEELNFLIKKTIKNCEKDIKTVKNNKMEMRIMKMRKMMTAVAAVAIAFVGVVNASGTVAYAMYDVPVIGNLAKIVTFREYKYDNNMVDVDVKVPSVENTGNKELEKRINSEIQKKMEEIVAQGEKESKEYKEAYIATGGDPTDNRQFSVTADYEMKYSNEKVLSFIINKCITSASADVATYYYNINIKTGEELKISDVLGKNYKEIVNESVKKQIKERIESNGDMFFGSENDKEVGIEGFVGIDENQNFFINEKGNVVVKFDKYEIAPGCMGMPEFEIAPMVEMN